MGIEPPLQKIIKVSLFFRNIIYLQNIYKTMLKYHLLNQKEKEELRRQLEAEAKEQQTQQTPIDDTIKDEPEKKVEKEEQIQKQRTQIYQKKQKEKEGPKKKWRDIKNLGKIQF